MSGSRHVKSYPNSIIIHEIGSLLIFHVVLYTRTATTSSLWRFVAPRFRGIKAYSILVCGLIMTRIHRTHYLIIENAFIVIHVLRIIRIETVQILGELSKIIGTTGLVDRWLGAQLSPTPTANISTHRGDLRVGLTEHLPIAYATHRITVASLNHCPEVLRQVVVIGIVVSTEGAKRTYHHRYMLVGMTRTDSIYILSKRIKEGRTVEIVGSLYQMSLLFSCSCHLRQA